jgi:hypothetical protein
MKKSYYYSLPITEKQAKQRDLQWYTGLLPCAPALVLTCHPALCTKPWSPCASSCFLALVQVGFKPVRNSGWKPERGQFLLWHPSYKSRINCFTASLTPWSQLFSHWTHHCF